MMKKIKLASILFAIGAMGMVACGGNHGGENGGGGEEQDTDTDGTFAQIDVPEGITPKVVFWHTFGDKIETEVQDQLDSFKAAVKAKEGVDLDTELFHYGNYNDTVTVIGSNLSTGTGPTMAIGYPDSAASLMKQYPGQIVNMQDYLSSSQYGLGTDGYLGDTAKKQKNEKDFIKSYLDEGRAFDVDGTYVLPYMKSSEIMLYNMDAMKTIMPQFKPGMKEGQIEDYLRGISFDELMEIAAYAYTNKGSLGLTSLDYPVYYDSDSNLIISQLEQKGLKFATRGESGEVVLNLDKNKDLENYNAVKAVIEQYRTWHSNHLLTTKGDQGTYASDAFKNQKSIFCIGSSGGAGYSFPETGSFDFRVCKVPYGGESEDTAKYISQGPSIIFFTDKSRTAEENQYDLIYSWKFYKYITNTQNNCVVCFNHSEGYVPVKNSCYRSSDWQDYIADSDNMYPKCALVLREEIGDNFITSLVFNGSATYRTEAGAIVTSALKTNNDIGTLIDTAVNNTYVAMGS